MHEVMKISVFSAICAGLYTDGLCVEMRKEEMICISGLCDSVRVYVFYQFISISVLLVLVCILLACLCVCACVCVCVCVRKWVTLCKHV